MRATARLDRPRMSALRAGVLAALLPAGAGAAGNEPFSFLFLDANARAAAMGGSYTALASDANALLYNPAGLGRVPSHEATFMHNQHFEGVTQEYAAYAGPAGLGASLNFLNFGPTPRTTRSNRTGVGADGVRLTDLSAALGYGRAVGESLALGAGARYIRETIGGIAAGGFAADLGALYEPGWLEGLRLAAAVQHLGAPVRFQSARENLPLTPRVGAAYSFSPAGQLTTVSVDLSRTRTERPVYAAGVETVIAGALALRAGFNSRNDAGPAVSAGFGGRYRSVAIDYAMVPYGDLGLAHRVSITLRWEGRRPPTRPRREYDPKYGLPNRSETGREPRQRGEPEPAVEEVIGPANDEVNKYPELPRKKKRQREWWE